MVMAAMLCWMETYKEYVKRTSQTLFEQSYKSLGLNFQPSDLYFRGYYTVKQISWTCRFIKFKPIRTNSVHGCHLWWRSKEKWGKFL